ncbi:sulfurtransferase complex subunit TusB [Budvicia diplopodorum]|uniref:sulfurtransferase complex subunit TusB n=1 Tax=Budvicia diplopodorum TaxID=1119056 RepID=UPI00135A3F83|nr:sulfurtransferase complex subunit TusB [Budvicia diplopodorum]
MLHTVSHSLYQIDIDALLQSIGSNDGILLLQDGVTSVVSGNRLLSSLLNMGVPVYALSEDILARGLQHRVDGHIKLINYTGFVELTTHHRQQMFW